MNETDCCQSADEALNFLKTRTPNCICSSVEKRILAMDSSPPELRVDVVHTKNGIASLTPVERKPLTFELARNLIDDGLVTRLKQSGPLYELSLKGIRRAENRIRAIG